MKTTALAFDSEKDSALYFDKVIPVNFNSFVMDETPFIEKRRKTCIEIIKEILPDEYKVNVSCPKTPYEILGINEVFYDYFSSKMNPGLYAFTATNFEQKVFDDLKDDAIQKLIPFMKSEYAFVDSSQEIKESKDGNETCVRLSGLKLIDTSKVTWEQILEIRKDKDSIYKLRNLRAFFENNYKEHDDNYIKDDFYVKMEDYQKAAKKHGFELVTKAISYMTPISQVATGFLYPIFNKQGIEIQDIVKTAIPLTIELGLCVLNIFTSKYEWHGIVSSNPVAFIVDTNQKLGNKI